MDVSSDNSGSVKVDGSAPPYYPSVFSIPLFSTVTLEAVPGFGYTFSGWSGAVTGTDNPTSLYVNCDKSVLATFIPQSSGTAKLYFPHVETGLPWQTEIAIINTSPFQGITGTLKAYSDDGQFIEAKAVTLSFRGRSEITVSGAFTNHTDIGYIIFETDSTAVQGYTKFYQEGTYRAAIPAVKEASTSSEIFISHVASDDRWWTGLSLLNTTPSTKELTISFDNGESRRITLAANQHRVVDIARDFFGNQPQPDIRSAVIANAGGIIGLELFGSSVGGSQMDGIPLTGKTSSTIYYPHVADDGWWTGIVAYNPAALAGSMTITSYDDDGNVLAAQTLPIAGKGKYVGTTAELGLPAQAAWFKIDSTSPLTGFELFGTLGNDLLAAYAGGGGPGARRGIFPKIEKSGWTGIAFVNTEASAAAVTLIAYNDNGSEMAKRVLSVGGHAKVVELAETLLAPQDIGNATYIAYSSDRNIVGFQLNGSSDGMMLDGLPGLAGTN
ncbi:MAG: InlB B-repeat-containing protein [Syntrophales bacterium]